MHRPWFLKPNCLQPPCLHCALVVGTPGRGLTATPRGTRPVASLGGAFGDSAPPAPTLYWETVSLEALVTYTLSPSGLTAIPNGPPPAATVRGTFGESFPITGLMSYCETLSVSWL